MTLGLKNSFASASSAACSASVNGVLSFWFPSAAICTGKCSATDDAGMPVPGVWIPRERSSVYVRLVRHEWKVGLHAFVPGRVMGTSIVAE